MNQYIPCGTIFWLDCTNQSELDKALKKARLMQHYAYKLKVLLFQLFIEVGNIHFCLFLFEEAHLPLLAVIAKVKEFQTNIYHVLCRITMNIKYV